MANGLSVINGSGGAVGIFGQAGAQLSLSQRALAAMQARQGAPSELGGGITGGFGVISYKGKVWRIKHNGEDTPLEDVDARTGMRTARAYIEAVIVASTPHLTKTWYEQAYVEGSNAPPDCASSDGVKPDAASPKRQNDLCATCKWNQFGTRASADGGGRGKACQDTKRLAVVPYPDLHNEEFGGPMLLRIPPASLRNLQNFAGLMDRNGYPFYGVSVYLYFVGDEAYPQIDFKPARPLNDDEFAVIEAFRKDDRVARILNTPELSAVPAIAAPVEQPLFGGPPGAPVQQAPVQQAPVQQAPAPQQPVPQQPAPQQPAPQQPMHMQPAPAVNDQQFAPHSQHPVPPQQPVQAMPPANAPVQQPHVPANSIPQPPMQQMPQEVVQQPRQAPPPVPQAPAPVQAAPAAGEAPGAATGHAVDLDTWLDGMAGM